MLQGAKEKYKEMNSAMAKFQWGQKKNEVRIHWKSWKSLTKAKAVRGMGFKDFEMFNTVLLAKQGWRLMQNKNTFWAKVMKG